MRQLMLLLIIIFFLFPTRLALSLHCSSHRISVNIRLLAFSLFPLKKRFTYSFSADDISHLPSLLPSAPKISGRLRQSKNLLSNILPNIHIQKLSAELHLASTDKYRISMLYGLYWWLWGIFAPLRPPKYDLRFIPEYQNQSSSLALNGIFSLTLGQIIFSVLLLLSKKIYFYLQRRFKHGQPSY